MIQDIGAFRFHNEFKHMEPDQNSRFLCYRGREVLIHGSEKGIAFPGYWEIFNGAEGEKPSCQYLFSIDNISYFEIKEQAPRWTVDSLKNVHWESIDKLRTAMPREAVFAAATGYQLASWYDSRKYCPRCGTRMVHDPRERMMRCPDCGQMEYPKICPAVIVGVIHDDKILLTKYAGGAYRKYALIAGFAEIGEPIEDTVRREVMEEVGLKVKNLRYYKSQPWSFSDTLLFGFFVDLDGGDDIRLDEMELSEAKWCTREEVPEDDGVSLTREMMRVFKEGKI